MTTGYVLVVFAAVIVLMIVLISKFKVNAAMGILIAAMVLAIALGTPWQDIEGTINSGFSGTIKSVAIIIFLGCTMGTILEKTGAAVRITKWAVGLVGEKNMIWAIAFSSAILGIPIFADTVVILLIPIVSLLAVQTKKSMMSYGAALYLGALVTASLVPPTPGPVSAAALLNVPLGQAILWGLIVAIPSVIAATFYCMTLKTPVAPKEEFIRSAKEMENQPLPSLTKSLLPILFPLFLILLNTITSKTTSWASVARIKASTGAPCPPRPPSSASPPSSPSCWATRAAAPLLRWAAGWRTTRWAIRSSPLAGTTTLPITSGPRASSYSLFPRGWIWTSPPWGSPPPAPCTPG